MSVLLNVIDRRTNTSRFCYRALEFPRNRFLRPKITSFENLSSPSFFEIRFHDLYTFKHCTFLTRSSNENFQICFATGRGQSNVVVKNITNEN